MLRSKNKTSLLFQTRKRMKIYPGWRSHKEAAGPGKRSDISDKKREQNSAIGLIQYASSVTLFQLLLIKKFILRFLSGLFFTHISLVFQNIQILCSEMFRETVLLLRNSDTHAILKFYDTNIKIRTEHANLGNQWNNSEQFIQIFYTLLILKKESLLS